MGNERPGRLVHNLFAGCIARIELGCPAPIALGCIALVVVGCIALVVMGCIAWIFLGCIARIVQGCVAHSIVTQTLRAAHAHIQLTSASRCPMLRGCRPTTTTNTRVSGGPGCLSRSPAEENLPIYSSLPASVDSRLTAALACHWGSEWYLISPEYVLEQQIALVPSLLLLLEGNLEHSSFLSLPRKNHTFRGKLLKGLSEHAQGQDQRLSYYIMTTAVEVSTERAMDIKDMWKDIQVGINTEEGLLAQRCISRVGRSHDGAHGSIVCWSTI